MKKPINNSILAVVLALAGSTATADSTFSSYDANNDGIFDQNEFNSYVGDAGLYSEWDADNDGFINEGEFDALGFSDDFDAWDADGDSFVDSSELYDGTYNYFDDDENGHWDGNEWDDANETGLFDV